MRRSDVREWLEGLTRFDSLDARRARHLLGILDENQRVLDLCADAGLIDPNEGPAPDIIPLLRMFLPC